MRSNFPIEFKKSNFIFTVLYLKNKDITVIKKAIQEKMYCVPFFLKSSSIIFDISNLFELHTILKLCNIIESFGLKIIGVTGCNDVQLRKLINSAGIQLFNTYHMLKIDNKDNRINKYQKTQVINNHVRSGQRVYAINSDLIINTHVSEGAELIADGNIHIYGNMRGRALAGASGDTDSQIYCTNLQAELISIAGRFWLNEQIPSNFIGKGARLYLVHNKMTIDNII
uniref:Probable septum site-determining protein MinC n=1 Tax=Candidatus Aschnera chinzeii TaxID=1485666 RepID=A0AAT9G4Q7_9ENTR|nr:MAG: septum site-determining protein MinC [Candidatus Aschnera chinzeii]